MSVLRPAPKPRPTLNRCEWRLQLMEQNKVFSPIADQGQLAHLSATHSNALVENPFDDAVEADTAAEK
ncbi:hypothetical protein SSIG_06918 [Streptomyces filamentosus NRRL 11379]|nr:predicted protein [Streptomyces filamentosus NRRL 15998]EWS96123.1 hypothetical protein SSIG_06918 [Streptomyces filamentosus NRRL 11379]